TRPGVEEVPSSRVFFGKRRGHPFRQHLKARECRPPDVPLVVPQVLAIDLQQVEGVQKCLARSQSPDRRAQPVEIRHAARAAHHTLAVDRHRLDAQLRQRLCDPGYPVSPVVTAPGKHADPFAITAADEPEAVVVDLMHPLRPGWHATRQRRQAGLDEAKGMTARGVRAPEHGQSDTVDRWPRQSTIAEAPTRQGSALYTDARTENALLTSDIAARRRTRTDS